jgi:hypothetical protein
MEKEPDGKNGSRRKAAKEEKAEKIVRIPEFMKSVFVW